MAELFEGMNRKRFNFNEFTKVKKNIENNG